MLNFVNGQGKAYFKLVLCKWLLNPTAVVIILVDGKI